MASTPITVFTGSPGIFRASVMENRKRFVEFDQYCKTCRHEKLAESDSPCDECLEHPVNTESHKPVCYEGRD